MSRPLNLHAHLCGCHMRIGVGPKKEKGARCADCGRVFIEFSKYWPCSHCGELRFKHADDKCLFAPTFFYPVIGNPTAEAAWLAAENQLETG